MMAFRKLASAPFRRREQKSSTAWANRDETDRVRLAFQDSVEAGANTLGEAVLDAGRDLRRRRDVH